MSDSLRPHELYSSWNSLGQNTGVGSVSLLQGIFPTQGLNPGLPHCIWILYQLTHKGSPRILKWVSLWKFQPRNSTRVSSMVGGFFTNWAIREALTKDKPTLYRSRCIWYMCKWKSLVWILSFFIFFKKCPNFFKYDVSNRVRMVFQKIKESAW